MKTIAIGDIHGHYKELIELLDKLENEHNIDFESDRLIFVGDYVDGGPQTSDVIEHLIYLQETYPQTICLYGNHEDLLLDALRENHPIYKSFDLWWMQGGKETHLSYAEKITDDLYEQKLIAPEQAIPQKHLKWMNNLPTHWENDQYFFVHGGITPGKSIEWNKENMTRYDMIWMREPFLESEYQWEKKIIFGHTVQKGYKPLVMKNKIGIDTFNHTVGKLTAVILPEEKIVQTNLSYTEEDYQRAMAGLMYGTL